MLVAFVMVAVALGVPALMLAQGTTVEAGQLLYLVRRPGLLARSVFAAVVAAPCFVLLIGWLLRPEPAALVGLAVLAASPVAPVMLVNVRRATGGAEFVASLHLTLAILSIATTPLVLALLSRSLGFEATARPLAVAGQVGRALVLPFLLGVAARTWTPSFANRARRPLAALAATVLLLAVLALLVRPETWHVLGAMRPRSYLAMGALLLACLAVGEALGGASSERRAALALEAAARNPGLALLIGSQNFDPHRALAVLLPYVLLTVALISLYVGWRARRLATA
ncbi:MAG: bile acid:sodium symporter [Myxococcales bacterium]